MERTARQKSKQMLSTKNCILKCVVTGGMALCVVGCTQLPDEVLDKDDMVDLLVDIHKGESVVDIQRGAYSNDSLKKVVKQSILLKHGVTQAQLDSSFVWYGNHIEDYLKIYDEVIKVLEDELKQSKGSTRNAPVFAEGDSIDVWPMSRTYKLSHGDLVRNIVFDMPKDDTWEKGDNYLLQFKLLNNRNNAPGIKAVVYAAYDDGRIELRPSSTVTNGWVRVRLVTDSTRYPSSVFGAITYSPDDGGSVYLDSVSLVRTRNRKDTYFERNGQRTISIKDI